MGFEKFWSSHTQPSASRSAQKNFGTTVEIFTDLEEISHLISDEEYNLLSQDTKIISVFGVLGMYHQLLGIIKPGALVLFLQKDCFCSM